MAFHFTTLRSVFASRSFQTLQVRQRPVPIASASGHIWCGCMIGSIAWCNAVPLGAVFCCLSIRMSRGTRTLQPSPRSFSLLTRLTRSSSGKYAFTRLLRNSFWRMLLCSFGPLLLNHWPTAKWGALENSRPNNILMPDTIYDPQSLSVTSSEQGTKLEAWVSYLYEGLW